MLCINLIFYKWLWFGTRVKCISTITILMEWNVHLYVGLICLSLSLNRDFTDTCAQGGGGFLDNFQIWGPCMDFTQYIHLNFNGNHAVYVTYVIIYIYCIKFKTHNKLNVANGMVPRAKANCYILFCILHTWNRFQYHYLWYIK